MSLPKKYASFLILAIFVMSNAAKSSADVKDVRVAIYNLLPNNAGFTIHCKSKDNDLGSHTIAAAGHYEFSFDVNVFGTTLFFCRVSWQGGQVTFDIYKASRDQGRCKHYCYWDVKAKGVEGFKESTSSTPDIVIPWS